MSTRAKQVAELVTSDNNRPLTYRSEPTAANKAPAQAFRFAVSSPFQFADATKEADPTSAAFELLARTGDAIEHWYWGRIVHDFAGMSHRSSIPVDYCHETREPIGVANEFDASSGDLLIRGSIESIDDGDEAAKLIARSRRGIPYQASIHFDPGAMVVEFVPEGMLASVNGREIAGPVVVARQWTLRGVAICPHGADVGTECELEADAVGEFSLTWKGTTMSKPIDATTPTDAGKLTEGTPGTPGTPANAPASAGSTIDAGDARAQFQAELKRFTERFPDVGAGYFAEGLDYTAASDRYIGKLSADLAAATQARDEAIAKIEAAKLSHGEPSPIHSTGASGKTVAFGSLFKKA